MLLVALLACPDSEPSPEPGFEAAVRQPNPTCLAPGRPPAPAADLQFTRVYETRYFRQPVGLYPVPGADGDWIVIERSGLVYRFGADDEAAEVLVADLSDVVYAVGSEQGLLGLAFHPDFESNGEIYLSYTSDAGAYSRLARVVSADGGLSFVADPEVIFSVEQPYSNHNGGNIAFGPDGYLYVGYGDGGSAGDPLANAQNVDVTLGKMLRIDVDGGEPYGIPSDNPFADGGGAPEVYAWGFRNPWRWTFDAETGDLWVGDVGQNLWEELSRVERGGNYGWDQMEGLECYGNTDCDPAGMQLPVVVYAQVDGEFASIVAGPVYRGTAIPSLVGVPIFSDVYLGTVWGAVQDVSSGAYSAEELVAAGGQIFVSYAERTDGEVIGLDYNGGLWLLEPAAPPELPEPSTFPELLSATGCVEASDPTQPVPAMVAYDVNVPLWSDGADKQRWFALPDGTSATVGPSGVLDFPIGTVIVKEFSFGNRKVETRLFVRHDDGEWAGYSYAWNEAGTDAEVLLSSAQRSFPEGDWAYPSRAQCLQCHTAAAGRVLGLRLDQLSRDVESPSGATVDQVGELRRLGFIDPTSILPLVTPLPAGDADAPLDARARAYLDVQCAHCHQPESTGLTDLDLRSTVSLAAAGFCDALPQAGDLDVADARLFAPGAPERSLISVRMHSTDVNRMPALASEVVDESGVALVDEWIAATGSCP